MILSEVVCAAAKVERGGQLCHLTEHSVISLCDTKYVLYSVICKNIIVFVTIKFLSVSNSFVHLKSLPFARKKLSYIQRRTINIRVPLNITNHPALIELQSRDIWIRLICDKLLSLQTYLNSKRYQTNRFLMYCRQKLP